MQRIRQATQQEWRTVTQAEAAVQSASSVSRNPRPNRRWLSLAAAASVAVIAGVLGWNSFLENPVNDGAVVGQLARFEAPLWLRLNDAARAQDWPRFARWNDDYLAARETAELRAETRQMGLSLVRVMPALGLPPPPCAPIAFPSAFAAASAALGIDRAGGLAAYLWAWAENQVLAAVKAIPLGQTDGQRMLLALGERVPALVEAALACPDDALGNLAPGLAILASRHETQYSRLFRS